MQYCKTQFLKKLLNLDIVIFLIVKIIQFYLKIILLTSKTQIKINTLAEIILRSKKACFVVLWHGRLLIFPKIMAKFGKFKALVSLHKDGKYVEKFIGLYGHNVIKGSTYKGGLSATKDIIRCINNNDNIVITPDGPRGPRYRISSAVTNIATKFNIPIICISFSSTRVKILNTWDKFIIPLPFGKIFIDISSPKYFTEKDDKKLERLMLEQMQSLDKKCHQKTQ